MFAFPNVDKLWHEINTRLVCQDIAFLQPLAHTQRSHTENLYRLNFLVVANIYLTEVFHIVNIETHHVAKSVRHKHCVCALLYGFLHVALHKSESLESFGKDFASLQVNRLVSLARLHHWNRAVYRIEHNLVNILLSLRELSTNGESTGIIRSIAHISLCARVVEQQIASVQYVFMSMVVKDLSVLRDYRVERSQKTMLEAYTLDCTIDFVFRNAFLSHLHCGGVHFVANFGSSLQFLYFAGFLYITQSDNSLYQWKRRTFLQFRNRNTQHRRKENHIVVTVWRKEMNLGLCRLHIFFKFCSRTNINHTATGSQFLNGSNLAHPHNIVNG